MKEEKKICPYLGHIPTWPDGSVLAQKIDMAIRAGQTTSMGGPLRARRRSLALYQKEASEKIGCSPQQLRSWDQGRNWPSSYYLPMIAAAYRCSIEDLYLYP